MNYNQNAKIFQPQKPTCLWQNLNVHNVYVQNTLNLNVIPHINSQKVERADILKMKES